MGCPRRTEQSPGQNRSTEQEKMKSRNWEASMEHIQNLVVDRQFDINIAEGL
jgi:hypothetical protein